LAFEIHRPVGGPDGFQDVHVLVRAGVAFILCCPVAVARLVHVVPAGDDVDGGAAVGELVQRGVGTGGVGGCHKAGAVGDEEGDAFRVGGGVSGDLQSVRPVGEPADEDTVEPAVLMRQDGIAQVVGVDGLAAGRMDLRLQARLDHADEFKGHAC
jgi:hypothetical protein